MRRVNLSTVTFNLRLIAAFLTELVGLYEAMMHEVNVTSFLAVAIKIGAA